ncbi:chitinase [Streptomyces sp. NPDC050560]|uniref:chitinase n=1 Tax=Streptomyces sp. NPDC050560 TaxID=3365630 RepID=UPI00379CABF7
MDRAAKHTDPRRHGRPRRSRTALAALVTAALAAAGFALAGPAIGADDGDSPQAAAHSAAAVPEHAVTGYWQNFDNGAQVQTLADVPDQYDIIAVAFADATATPGAVDFTLDSAGLGGYTEDQFKADIKAKQDAGKSVVISIGGQNGTVSVSDDASASAFADSVHSLMEEYGFDGVDIDLENGLNSTYMSQALKSVDQQAGGGTVITMAPQTIDMQSTSNEYFKTALDIKDILTVVNMQYYNSGSMLGCDGNVYNQGSVDFLTALACIQLQGGLDPSQVGLGVPASSSAAGSGYVDPGVVNDALDCLTQGTNCGSFKPDTTWPGLRGAMTWSTNWDASAGNAWSDSVGAHVHGL